MNGNSVTPIIIKRKKVVSGDGHHGGAWKVAYADFVTAMMAFFMLMWLLNATTEKQRKGLADYFDPTIPIVRISGGGHGAFAGDSVFTEETLVASGNSNDAAEYSEGHQSVENADLFAEIQRGIEDQRRDSAPGGVLQDHISSRVTDEGLVITIHDTERASLFSPHGIEPTELLTDLISVLAETFKLSKNKIAIEGHINMQPVVILKDPGWQVSTQRAQIIRELLEEGDVNAKRISRVTGWADRNPRKTPAVSIENNRIDIILLR